MSRLFSELTEGIHRVKGGLYWNRCRLSAPNALVEDTDLRAKMWAAWMVKLGLHEEL